MENIKFITSDYTNLLQSSGEQLNAVLVKVKEQCKGDWNPQVAKELNALAVSLIEAGKPAKICQSLQGLSKLQATPWGHENPEKVGTTVYKFWKLGLKLWDTF